MPDPLLCFALVVQLITQLMVVDANTQRNVLLIIADDLRPELNAAYGRNEATTPNLDAFATSPYTLVIDQAYAQYPSCTPSRSSFLTGLSPTTLSLYRQNQPLSRGGKTSLPVFFSLLKYKTYKGGKVFHPKQKGTDLFKKDLFADSASSSNKHACLDRKKSRPISFGNTTLDPEVGCITDNLMDIPDIILAKKAAAKIKKLDLKKKKKPFLMMIGFWKPHLPYIFDNQFEIDPENIKDTENWDKSGPNPRESYSDSLTLDPSMSLYEQGFNSNPWEEQKSKYHPDETYRRRLKAAYLATVSQTDAAVGIVLGALNNTKKLRDKTLVIFMSDHSFALGENRMWGKETLFDHALRVPMLIHVPWLSEAKPGGIKRSGNAFFMQSLDLYRTIAGLIGVSKFVQPNIEGQDKSQLILTHLAGSPVEGSRQQQEAYSVVARCHSGACSRSASISNFGYTIRTPKYRYTVFFNAENDKVVPKDAGIEDVLQQELYLTAGSDQETIFNYKNGTSFATNHENVFQEYPEICEDLFQRLKQHFKF